MKIAKNAFLYLSFIAASVLFLIIEQLTHIEFFLHLAAIPIEILVAVFIVERLLERRELKEKRRQLMFIKSTMFRSDMRNLFITNFANLKSPALSMSKIKSASLKELQQMRREAEKIEYQSLESMEPIIMEYVNAQRVWVSFMERAITCNFEDIFHNMIYILHFIHDVKAFKERNKGGLFIHEAEKREWQMRKVKNVLEDGIRKFLDYVIELKEEQPDVFTELMEDYDQTEIMLHSSNALPHGKVE